MHIIDLIKRRNVTAESARKVATQDKDYRYAINAVLDEINRNAKGGIYLARVALTKDSVSVGMSHPEAALYDKFTAVVCRYPSTTSWLLFEELHIRGFEYEYTHSLDNTTYITINWLPSKGRVTK